MLKSDVIRTPDGATAPLPMHSVDEVAMKVVDWMAQTSA